MFPFQMGNEYLNPSFPYHMNYQLMRPAYHQINSYFNPYGYPNLGLQHQSSIPSYPEINQRPYFTERYQDPMKSEIGKVEKKKRITKKLALAEMRKKLRVVSKQSKSKRNKFKYFDPSRAPPLTSLRNSFQLEMDLKKQQQRLLKQSSQQQYPINKSASDILKLQIILKQPNMRQYPFLICKKRKYYRHLKRRYSVVFFQQRAFYITNKKPIPSTLQPKNKVRRSRIQNKNSTDAINRNSSQSSSECSSDEYSVFSEQRKAGGMKDLIKLQQKGQCQNRQVEKQMGCPESQNDYYS